MSRVSRYYRPLPAMEKKLQKALDAARGLMALAVAYAKEVGARSNPMYTSQSIFTGTRRVTGFIFDVPPDPKIWKRLKTTDDGWCPRARTPEAAKFAELVSDDIGSIKTLLRLKDRIYGTANGLRSMQLGLEHLGGKIYLTTDSEDEPYQCRRISDIDYEKARQAHKASKRKKKRTA